MLNSENILVQANVLKLQSAGILYLTLVPAQVDKANVPGKQ